MGNENLETQAQQIENLNLSAEDRFAARIAEERHGRLLALAEETAAGTAKVAVNVEDIKAKVDAVLEAVAPSEAEYGMVGQFALKANKVLDQVWLYLRPVAAAVVVGAGAVKGVQGIQSWRRARAEKAQAAQAAAAPPAMTPSAS